MKKLAIGILLAFFVTLIFAPCAFPQQPVDGTLTFTIKTVSNGATYSPKNVLAIWIKDAAGNFVISRKVMANARKQHLVKWVANSGNNVTDATTGATLPNHQTHTVTWNCHDANGLLVPDGDYQVWVEYTSRNSASGGNPGPSTSFTFTKGASAVNLTPANETYFQDIVLSYIPLNVSVSEKAKTLQEISVYPNPFSSETNIQFTILTNAVVTANIFDIHGEIVTTLIHEIMPTGTHTKTWDGRNDSGAKVKAGIYTINLTAEGNTLSYKVVYQ